MINLLTENEKQIVALVFEGLRNKDIALKMGISVQDVKVYLNEIYKKLNVYNKVQLIVKLTCKIK